MSDEEEEVYRRSFDLGSVDKLTRRAWLDKAREAARWRARALELSGYLEETIALGREVLAAPRLGSLERANAARDLIAQTRAESVLGMHDEGRSVAYIARKVGITSRRVNQILVAARKKREARQVSD